MTLLAPIFEQDPDAIAYRSGESCVSYGQLCEDIDTMAYWLREQGVSHGTRLGIHFKGDSSYWTLIAHVGAIRLGACHITIANDQTMALALNHGLEVYLYARGDVAAPEPVKSFHLSPTGLNPLAEQLKVTPRKWKEKSAESQASRLAFTSGTTGESQGVLWTPDILARRVAQVRDHVSKDTRVFATLGLQTTAGVRYPIGVWQAGGMVLSRGVEDEVAEPSIRNIRSNNLMATSPIALAGMLRRVTDPWEGKDDRVIIVMGGRIPKGVRDKALQLACARLEINYGATEVGRVAKGDSSLLDRHPGAVGFITDEAIVEVVDEEGRSLPHGARGIVRIKSPAMAHGYETPVESAGKQARNTSSFRDGWFYPGDLGIVFDDGLFAVAGRIAETVNIGGLKVQLADLEAKLSELPGIDDLCVVPVNTPGGDLLAVVAVLGQGVERAALREEIRGNIPRNCPVQLIAAPEIPRNAMGKIARDQVAQRVRKTMQQLGAQRAKHGSAPVA